MRSDPTSQSDAWANVYRWAYRFMRNHDGAMDATQEVMLRSVQHGGANIRNDLGWLRRITVNHCIDTLRKKRPAIVEELEPPNRHPSPVHEAIGTETAELITTALEKLTEQQRAVVVAKTYDGETFAAIAESMGLSIGTVKTHYLRGLSTLRNALGKLREYR
ncbi:MAG: sigma-70 family RNA polymerase sigma factor [Phycisphaerales bacterium]|nr:sigma-70 family RNA polymerase sigma factor [Phycisphaerales bacterium]